jgi:hypothetical protein
MGLGYAKVPFSMKNKKLPLINPPIKLLNVELGASKG